MEKIKGCTPTCWTDDEQLAMFCEENRAEILHVLKMAGMLKDATAYNQDPCLMTLADAANALLEKGNYKAWK